MVNLNSTIISGAGALNAIDPLLADKRAILLVSDKNIITLAPVQQLMKQLGASGRTLHIVDSVPPEPSQHNVQHIVAKLNGVQPDMVVGIGGGSVLDVAKLLSVLCHSQAPGLDEQIGRAHV